jgi:glutathione S-transferase
MELVGMLDSPYVRRVAVSLQLMGLRFTHNNLSVFRTYPQFAAINPVVKAPSFVCEDGGVLMDSTLILDHAESLVPPQRRLMPADPRERQQALRVVGLALAALEKSVQIIYERAIRPPEMQYAPWIDRVTGQLKAACRVLEEEVAKRPFAPAAERIDQAGVTTAVAWTFLQALVAPQVPAAEHPALVAWTDEAERLPAFRAAPHTDEAMRAP